MWLLIEPTACQSHRASLLQLCLGGPGQAGALGVTGVIETVKEAHQLPSGSAGPAPPLLLKSILLSHPH